MSVLSVLKKWPKSGGYLLAQYKKQCPGKRNSVGVRQYAKRKRLDEEKEGTPRKSKHLKGKVPSTTVMAPEDKRKSAPEGDPDEEPVETSSGEELPDIP